ncbi:hypothetical protein BFP76_11290 [Amylibacter kogurei]|uniref:Glutamine ABC transporter substrate-binding protein n=1 Tax=Paramylibacter kogurei TaxID=1889778 RepID=A0A2G5KBD5_9RHOB|nr:transporter substrate-binding domain-containing protein [Amylibacter kogurei]PIB26489.1 hypothetical protein BFP76_11290 [Amylibacter kogurei]
MWVLRFARGFACVVLWLVVSLAPLTAQPELNLKIATIERKPFAFKENGEWTGFSIQLWQQIAENLGAKTEIIETTSFSEMLQMVEEAKVDLAAANISVTAAREEVMDFSRPIFDSGLLVLAKSDQTPSVFTAFMNPELWIWLVGAILLFLFAGLLIAIAERGHEHFKGRDKLDTWREGIWWAVSVVTNASFTIFTPHSKIGRGISYALILAGLFVVSAFVAQITASLTVEGLRTQISGINDIRDKRVGTTQASTSSRFLTNQAINHETFVSLDEMFDALQEGKVDALVHDAPILAYYAKTQGNGVFQTQGNVFNPEKYGFAFPQRSSQTERVNQEILRLKETGAYSTLVRNWFGSDYQ